MISLIIVECAFDSHLRPSLSSYDKAISGIALVFIVFTSSVQMTNGLVSWWPRHCQICTFYATVPYHKVCEETKQHSDQLRLRFATKTANCNTE